MNLTKAEISEIRSRLQAGEKGCDLAKFYGVSDSFISQVKHHKKCVKQIWLTLEEAQQILEAVCIAFGATERMSIGELMEEFAEKVERAEMSKESTREGRHVEE